MWIDSTRLKEAAEVMKITAKDLKEFGIIDDIIKEPRGGAHKHPEKAAENIKDEILNWISDIKDVDLDILIKNRYDKIRNMGNFY